MTDTTHPAVELGEADEMSPEEIAEYEAESAAVFNLAVRLMRADGNDGDPHQLIYTGGALPDPWGEAWQRYEDKAKQIVDLIGVDAAVSLSTTQEVAPLKPLPKGIAPSMPQTWYVSVVADGDTIINIGHDWMCGSRALEKQDEQTIIGAAQHLLSFVGYGLPEPSFDPDESTPPAAKEVAGPVAPQVLAFLEDVSKQKPEKPDYWSSCGQCDRNIDRAGELLEEIATPPTAQAATPAAVGDDA